MRTPTVEITTIDQYIAGFPEDIQVLLTKMRSTIRRAAPQAVEKISYRMPTFYQSGNLVHFAAFKNHIGFYPTGQGMAAFQDELKDYKTSKGAVQFPLDKPLPLRLITRIVKFRLAQNAQKAAPRSTKRAPG